MNQDKRDRKTVYSDEVTLHDIIHSSVSIIAWLKKNILGLSACILLSTALVIAWTYNQPDKYVAEYSFMLNDDNNPSISSVSGILGQLGIAPQSGKYNVAKLLEIAKSQKVLYETFLDKKEIGGRQDYVGNHLINALGLEDEWIKRKTEMHDYRLTHDKLDSLSSLDQFALKSLYHIVAGPKSNENTGLFSTADGNPDYIMSLYMESPSDSLSIVVVEAIYDKVSSFYVQKSKEKNQSIFDLLKSKKDSIDVEIKNVAYKAAQYKDQNAGSYKRSNEVQSSLLEGQLSGLLVLQEEVIKNLSRADYALHYLKMVYSYLD